jgi:hypothetical protein
MRNRFVMPHRGYRFVEIYKKAFMLRRSYPLTSSLPRENNPNAILSYVRAVIYYYPIASQLNAAASY